MKLCVHPAPEITTAERPNGSYTMPGDLVINRFSFSNSRTARKGFGFCVSRVWERGERPMPMQLAVIWSVEPT